MMKATFSWFERAYFNFCAHFNFKTQRRIYDTATSKMKLSVKLVNGFQSLTSSQGTPS